MSTTDETSIIFELGGSTYGLRSADVMHIEMLEHITPVPNTASAVDGVVFSRGQVVPVVNLRARFGFERVPYDERTRLLVVHADGRTVGLVADTAREFVSIPGSAIQPPHDALRDLSGQYLAGIAKVGDRMVLVLDTAQILKSTDGLPQPAAGPTQ